MLTPAGKMHADEVDTDVALVRRLFAAQFPQWADLPIQPVPSAGTDNALYRLGDDLVERGRLSAVIDFGGLGVGDPACDLMIAWGLFSGESRDVFHAALAVDDATWARGLGRALSWALIFIPYYLDTNPVGVSGARHVIDEVLADHEHAP